MSRSQVNLVRYVVMAYGVALIALGILGLAAVSRGDEPAEFTDQQILLHAEAQRHRVANGRDAQELDAECCAIAQRWAEHMAARRWMGHGGGEQIVAYGTSTAPATMRMWINSGGHNAWLLSSTRRAGWGAAQSRGGTWYWAGAFRGATAATATSNASYSNQRRWFRWRR